MTPLVRLIRKRMLKHALAVLLYAGWVLHFTVLDAVALRYFTAAISHSDERTLLLSLVVMTLVTLTSPLILFYSRLFSAREVFGLSSDLRGEVFESVVSFSRARESAVSAAGSSAILNDIALLAEGLMTDASEIVASVLSAFGTIALLAWWSPEVIALVCILAAVSVFVSSRFANPVKTAALAERERLADVVRHAHELVSGLLVLKTLHSEDAYMARLRSSTNKHHESLRRRGVISGTQTFSSLVTENLFQAGILLASGVFSFAGRTTPENAMGVYQLVGEGMPPIIRAGQSWANLHAAVAGAQRVESLLSLRSPSLAPGRFKPAPADGFIINTEHVSYSYPGRDSPVLRRVSVSIRPGEVVAVVGETGSGKSTFLRIVSGLIRDYQGSAAVLGAEVRDVPPRVSFCPQDLQLFRLSIRDNLELVLKASGGETAGLLGVRSREILEAFEFERMLSTLPRGWDTPVTDLSGGQKQRVAVVRSFLPDVLVVLLDEPVSSLDAENESIIYRGIRACKGTRTVVLATHRVTNLDWVDNILVFERGEIVEYGTFQHLIEENGYFAKLYRTQVGERPKVLET